MQGFQATTTSGNVVRFDGGTVAVVGGSGVELAAIPLASITQVTRLRSELVLLDRDGETTRLTFGTALDAERLEYLLTSRGVTGISAPGESGAPAKPWLKTASGKAMLVSLIVAVALMAITIALCISLSVMLDEDTLNGGETDTSFLSRPRVTLVPQAG